MRFSLDERVSTGPLLEQQRQQIENRLNAVKLLRKQIEEQPSNTHEDIERKSLMLKNADEQTRRLTYAADLLLAASWRPMPAAERESALNAALVEVEYKFKDVAVEELDRIAKARLQEVGVADRFHWPLEFPEVLDNGGLAAFVCNPPFMGGQKITGALGEPFREYIVARLAGGRRGNADLCSYFLLRAARLLRQPGQLGFLATNTIAQGDTREVGLDQLTADGCVIPRAVASSPWPGAASLEVAQVWLRRGAWAGAFMLDHKPAGGITAFLTPPGAVAGNPYRLKANEAKPYKGSCVLGIGFVLTEDEAQRLIERDSRNRDVLFPYLNGEDLNSRPDHSPSRWVINFFDWPLEKAEQYRDCIRILEERVKPERARNRYSEIAREKWWLYERWRPELYRTIAMMDCVMVKSEIGNKLSFALVPNTSVFSHMLYLFPTESVADLALLQSTIHDTWAWEYGSTMRTDLRYAPGDLFDTFAFPQSLAGLKNAGESYETCRRGIMLARNEGLTKTYNRFHDRGETSSDIEALRDLHAEMDRAVAGAYRWTDLELGHGFHETKQGLRFTISESARREVLARLLALNHQRHAEEVRQGLHEKKGRAKKTAAGKRVQPKPNLFDAEEEE